MSEVLLERPNDRVAVIRLNRPEARNALNLAVREALAKHFIANTIASMPPLAIMQIKEAVLAGEDASLEAGLMLERKAFQLLFATADQKEGMRAFLEKRKPEFEGR